MSTTRLVAVRCDGCWTQEVAPDTAKKLRERLHGRGWARKGWKDYCPRCCVRLGLHPERDDKKESA